MEGDGKEKWGSDDVAKKEEAANVFREDGLLDKTCASPSQQRNQRSTHATPRTDDQKARCSGICHSLSERLANCVSLQVGQSSCNGNIPSTSSLRVPEPLKRLVRSRQPRVYETEPI